MADGKSKPIVNVKPGDRVQAGDPTTGKHEGSRTVTAQLINHDTDLVDLTIQTGIHRSDTIHTTAKHPFWDDTLHAWVRAGDLKPGDNLETATNHHARILTIRTRPGAADMYNLTVQQLHTYYVLAGTTPVLVHNTGCGPTTDIYRVSPKSAGTSELDNGLDSANFPRTDDGEYDGAAHFGNKARVNDWAKNGGAGVAGQGYKVTVPTHWLEANADRYEGMTEDQMEYAIPFESFDEFNQFPRAPWSPGS